MLKTTIIKRCSVRHDAFGEINGFWTSQQLRYMAKPKKVTLNINK